jgi:hypothetical protein
MPLRDTEPRWDAVRTARTKPLVAPTIRKGAHWRGSSAHGHHQRRLGYSACLRDWRSGCSPC